MLSLDPHWREDKVNLLLAVDQGHFRCLGCVKVGGVTWTEGVERTYRLLRNRYHRC